MGGPSQTEVDRAEVDGVQLQTVEQRLASGSDMKARTPANSPLLPRLKQLSRTFE